MGQAKNRGSRQQRMEEAQSKFGSETPLHIFINENRSGNLLLADFPCAGCGESVTPDQEQNALLQVPVSHALQFGGCPNCGSMHVIASAATKADCIALEPVVKELKASMMS